MQIFRAGGTARGTLTPVVDPADGITPVTPSDVDCLVVKNGTDTGDAVTITAVGGGRVGVYKWSYTPSGAAEHDVYSLVFEVTIDGLPYYETVDLMAVVQERGTDSANTTAPATPADVANSEAAVLAKLPSALIGGRMDCHVGSMENSVLTAAAIAAGALDGKGDWPVGKSGYEITTTQFNALVAAIEVELLNDATGGAVIATIAAAVASYFDEADLDLPPQVIAEAVRSEIAVELARLDVAVSSRLATAGYTAPASAATISGQVASDLATAHGGGSWQTADVSGLPTVGQFEARTLPTAQYGTLANQQTLLARITSGVGSMFADLIAMITGSGLDPKWTVAALSNAPAGGGGGGSGDATEAKQDQIIAQIGALQAAGVMVTTPFVPSSQEIRLVRNSSYKAIHGRAIPLKPIDSQGQHVEDGWPNLTGAQISFGAGKDQARDLVVGTGSVVQPTGMQVIQIEFDHQTLSQLGRYRYEVQAVMPSTDKITLMTGWLDIREGFAS